MMLAPFQKDEIGKTPGQAGGQGQTDGARSDNRERGVAHQRRMICDDSEPRAEAMRFLIEAAGRPP